MLKLELKNMYILEEENKDLREELEQLKSLTYEARMKDLVEENKNLRKRNGMLLFNISELEAKVKELEQMKDSMSNVEIINTSKMPLTRP